MNSVLCFLGLPIILIALGLSLYKLQSMSV